MIPPTVDARPAPPLVRGGPAAREALLVSPELALVDDELRSEAIGLLPELRPFAFLERPPEPWPPDWLDAEGTFGEVADLPSLPVAVLAYLAAAILRTCAFNLAVFVSVAVLVLVLNVVS